MMVTVVLVVAVVAVGLLVWLKLQWKSPAADATTAPGRAVGTATIIRAQRAASSASKAGTTELTDGQLAGVLGRLKKLNPAFNPTAASVRHRTEDGLVTELAFSCAGVTNLAPLTVLAGLRELVLDNPSGKSPLADLSPLRGMSLTRLSLRNSSVADLSPLRGMPLGFLDIRGTAVTDLTPLTGIPVRELRLDMDMVQTKKDVQVLLEEMRRLQTINDLPVPDFLQKAATAPGLRGRGTVRPLLDQFTAAVAAMPAEKQLPAVMAKLKELNPAFDPAKAAHKIESGQVTELHVSSVGVKDIEPLRALRGLRKLSLSHWAGNGAGTRGGVSDLSPLRGLPLTWLYCHNTEVDDLGPLRGMPLTVLSCGGTRISDLSPLEGLPLTVLSVDNTAVASLKPLSGMPLTVLWCDKTQVTDLTPLGGMPLRELRCDFDKTRDYDVLAGIRTLARINDMTATMFWMITGPRPAGKGGNSSR
jgi:Leucine-rich repeat (LRR) protein